ncbi:helix-turn-helix domain-containing protein [Reyranella sp.]|uniref:helix-turn-helix domain-containing protein n=1 Tax=Reyranella sp. TaxID=1929291 RepID=UPI0040367408
MDTPATQLAVLARIRAFARANSWTAGRLASEAGLSRGTLARLFEADWLPSSSTVLQIEKLIPRDWRVGDPLPAPKKRKAA